MKNILIRLNDDGSIEKVFVMTNNTFKEVKNFQQEKIIESIFDGKIHKDCIADELFDKVRQSN